MFLQDGASEWGPLCKTPSVHGCGSREPVPVGPLVGVRVALEEVYFTGADVTTVTELDFAGPALPSPRKAISKPDSATNVLNNSSPFGLAPSEPK